MMFQYVKMKQDRTKLRQKIFEIVNFVNMVSQCFCYFWANSNTMMHKNGQLVCNLSCSVLTDLSRGLLLVSFAGIQTPKDLHRTGGVGDLVQW